MAKFKLNYFDFSASRGLECRLALFLNGVEFEDERISFADWPELKSNTPFGSMPVLHVEGRPSLAQSNAILTFIGREFGLHPKDPWDAARHEAIFCAVEDYRNAAVATDSKDEAEKKRLREGFAAGFLHRWAGNIDAQIKGPFVEGDALHLADVKIYVIVNSVMSGNIDYLDATAFKHAPKVVALHNAVAEHPKVKEWKALHAS